jgi:hypothetical protein
MVAPAMPSSLASIASQERLITMHIVYQYLLSEIYSLSNCAIVIISLCHKLIESCISMQRATLSLQASVINSERIDVLQDMHGVPLVEGGLVELFTDDGLTCMGTAKVVGNSADARFHGQPIGEGNITVMTFEPCDMAACGRQTAWHSDGDEVVQGQTPFTRISPQVIIKVPAARTKASSPSEEAADTWSLFGRNCSCRASLAMLCNRT